MQNSPLRRHKAAGGGGSNALPGRQALESRLTNISRAEKVDIQRLRRQIAFDRFLCRLFHAPAVPWALKGGYAMELRLATSRTTRDIDLTFRNLIAGGEKARNLRILDMIQKAAAVDLGDCFIFLVGEPMLELDGAPYGGERLPVEARMDGRLFQFGGLSMAPVAGRTPSWDARSRILEATA